MWLVVHLAFLTGFKNRIAAIANWTVAFLGHDRRQRAITEQQVLFRTHAVKRPEGAPPRFEDERVAPAMTQAHMRSGYPTGRSCALRARCRRCHAAVAALRPTGRRYAAIPGRRDWLEGRAKSK
jgi:hypothetical protein